MMSAALHKKTLSCSFGHIAYLEAGPEAAPPVLFIHGIPTSGYLWRDVLRLLQDDFHCYAPDLMGLGDTEVDPETGRFHMEAQAEMLEAFMSGLGHETFAVVCHDQGGAAAQLLAARRPQLLTCLVLTNCVCYDNWPVPAIARLQTLMRLPLLPGALVRLGLFKLLETRTPLSAFRRGVHDPRSMPDTSILEYLRPLHEGRQQRERFRKFLLAGNPCYTLAAVEGLRAFSKPTLVLWGADDRYISPSWGRKLHQDIPGAERFELIPCCGHFWQEERPAEFVAHMGPFLAAHAAGARDITPHKE